MCTGLSSPSSPRYCKHASPDSYTAASQMPLFIQFISKSFLVLIPLPPHRPKQVFLYLRIMPAVRSLKSLLWQRDSSGGLDPSVPYFLLFPTQTLGIIWKETSQASSKASLLRSLCLHWHAFLYMKYALAVPGQKTPNPPWLSATQCDFSWSFHFMITADPLWPLTACTHMWITYRIHKESCRLYLHFLHCPRSQVSFDKCLLNWITSLLRLRTSYYICLRVLFFSLLSSKKNLQLKCNTV